MLHEKCKKAAKTKGLILLRTFGISGFSYVANVTTEPLGEVAFLNGRWSNIEKALFKFFTQNASGLIAYLDTQIKEIHTKEALWQQSQLYQYLCH
ncbi:MAG: hypothetical protein ACI4E1_11390 [Lachnospira sp.]